MKKIFLAIVLVLQTFVCAEQCYFQTRRKSYDSMTKVKKISCQKAKNAVGDVRYYNGRDNYTPYFEENFGREGNIIMEENGYTLLPSLSHYKSKRRHCRVYSDTDNLTHFSLFSR